MLKNSVKQYEALKDSEYKNAAMRNVAFFAVAAELLQMDATYPKEIEPLVDKEVNAVEKHEGIAASTIFNIENLYFLYRCKISVLESTSSFPNETISFPPLA